MWRYRSYMYTLSLALLKWVASVCAIIADTCIYGRRPYKNGWRQYVPLSLIQIYIVASDSLCRRQYMLTTIHATCTVAGDNLCRRQYMP